MPEFNSIQDLASNMKVLLDSPSNKKKIITMYAFNATGKTRLSKLISYTGQSDEEIILEENSILTLCYNAFLEDIFTWDNENYVLNFDSNSWIATLVNEQGLERDIINNFQDIINSNIEPSFNIIGGTVTFHIIGGIDENNDNIKISKGEESMFIWSIFYTILETAIDSLNTSESDRSTTLFNNLKYIIIDDPVSSIDDTKIINMAIKLVETLKKYQGNDVKFLITSHHALFFNVLYNSFKRCTDVNYKSYCLSKNNNNYIISEQGDAPFSYHLSIKKVIENAIYNNTLERYHFNLFRNLLEKTSNFLGYNDWTHCITGERKAEFIRVINLYSHSKLSEFEYRELSIQDHELFVENYRIFNERFNWNN